MNTCQKFYFLLIETISKMLQPVQKRILNTYIKDTCNAEKNLQNAKSSKLVNIHGAVPSNK